MRSLDKDKNDDDEDIDDDSELMLVFDLGGGTFGLSYSRLAGVGVTEVLATIGNNRLDGDSAPVWSRHRVGGGGGGSAKSKRAGGVDDGDRGGRRNADNDAKTPNGNRVRGGGVVAYGNKSSRKEVGPGRSRCGRVAR